MRIILNFLYAEENILHIIIMYTAHGFIHKAHFISTYTWKTG